ncbi:tonB-dependent Receptor Plug domain protein, partial [Yersinia pestis PY-06]
MKRSELIYTSWGL